MRTYKYKIRTHSKNKRLGNMLDDLADVHNHFLKLEKRYYRLYGKYAGRYRLQPHLTKLLKTTKRHWAWIPRDTLDAAIIRIHDAYQRFFAGNGGIPKPKRTHRYRSAKFQTGYKLENGRVRISFKSWGDESHALKFNRIWYSFHQHRGWHGTVRYVQILRDSCGEYWLYVVTDDISTEPLSETGESVGIDFGLKTFLTLSTGEKITAPEFLKQSLKHLRKLNKSVSRKVRGSGNWYRAIRQLARLYRKVAHQRLDWQWKLATALCRRFDAITTENLNIDGMKRLWGRKVSDLAFYQFVQLLKFKCQKHKRQFLQVGQWTPTTSPCSHCGHQNEKLSLNDRQWTCTKCGTHHDRDINAAINILRAA
ncbi:MAG: RNA-guided endonuclease TnpB family protein [Candidatus Poribacteria bacterium]|nr:RNA-guided endonuclease TnpB family protein [Candidatus Poribacteria bacterium]